jgi:hypothetical protein
MSTFAAYQHVVARAINLSAPPTATPVNGSRSELPISTVPRLLTFAASMVSLVSMMGTTSLACTLPFGRRWLSPKQTMTRK